MKKTNLQVHHSLPVEVIHLPGEEMMKIDLPCPKLRDLHVEVMLQRIEIEIEIEIEIDLRGMKARRNAQKLSCFLAAILNLLLLLQERRVKLTLSVMRNLVTKRKYCERKRKKERKGETRTRTTTRTRTRTTTIKEILLVPMKSLQLGEKGKKKTVPLLLLGVEIEEEIVPKEIMKDTIKMREEIVVEVKIDTIEMIDIPVEVVVEVEVEVAVLVAVDAVL